MKNQTSLIIVALASLLSAGCSKQVNAPNRASAPNQALYEYLGNPVAAPAGLVAAYTKAGLTSAVKDAAQAANVTLKKVEIDDSEFPFLVGVICSDRGDIDKLEGQLQKAGYQVSGFIRGDPVCVMNLTPRATFPAQDRDQIQNRLDLRERIYFEKVRSNP